MQVYYKYYLSKEVSLEHRFSASGWAREPPSKRAASLGLA
jgi:hypothetical protein